MTTGSDVPRSDAYRYDVVVDVEAENNSVALAVRLAGWNKRILDIGCATGYLAQALVGRGCTVVGVDGDARAAERARRFAERVVVGDLDDPATIGELGDDTFDVVICGDVLEHMVDPVGVLRRAVERLRPDGIVIVSVPNVSHIDVRLALLQGRFPYTELGLLDRTHLRFFTAPTARGLLEEAGLVVLETHRTRAPAFGTEVAVAIDRRAVDGNLVRQLLRDDPDAETYQFVMVAMRHGAAVIATGLDDRCASLEAQVARLENQRDYLQRLLAPTTWRGLLRRLVVRVRGW